MKKLIPLICVMLLLFGCATRSDEAAPTPSTTAATPSSAPASTPVPSVSRTPVLSPAPDPAVELIAQAALPDVETGDWYEWDIAGNYPSNPGDLVYVESQGLLAYFDYASKQLIIRPIDGPCFTILDNDVSGQLSSYGQWIYYMKEDGFWKVETDGTGKHCFYKRDNVDGFDHLFIYEGRAYFWRDGTSILESTDLEGGDYQTADLTGNITWYAFFDQGYVYYCSADYTGETDSPTDMHLYRYSLEAGEAQEFVDNAWGPLIIRNGWAYYLNGDMERSDGRDSEKVLAKDDLRWDQFYNLFSSYLLYFNSDCQYGVHGGTLCALDVRSGQVYALFEVNEIRKTSIYIAQDSVFLYSGYYGTRLYRITFEDGQAYLWRLNNIDAGR